MSRQPCFERLSCDWFCTVVILAKKEWQQCCLRHACAPFVQTHDRRICTARTAGSYFEGFSVLYAAPGACRHSLSAHVCLWYHLLPTLSLLRSTINSPSLSLFFASSHTWCLSNCTFLCVHFLQHFHIFDFYLLSFLMFSSSRLSYLYFVVFHGYFNSFSPLYNRKEYFPRNIYFSCLHFSKVIILCISNYMLRVFAFNI